MKRLGYFEIADKRYPLSFSLGASKAIAQKFGSISVMGETLNNMQDMDERTIDDLTYIVSLLMKQGAAYKNVFEKDFPVPEDAPVDENGKYVALDQEQVEIGIGISDAKELIGAIMEAMGKGTERELEVDITKNPEAPEEMETSTLTSGADN